MIVGEGASLNYGHRVNPGKSFVCLDCGLADSTAMQVQAVDSCPENPTGLCLAVWDETGPELARISADHWKRQADRVALRYRDFAYVDGDDSVCARFTFDGEPYEVRYGMKKAGHVGGNALRAYPVNG